MKDMTVYEFTLVLDGVDDETENLEDAFFEAGCDDALVNFRHHLMLQAANISS